VDAATPMGDSVDDPIGRLPGRPPRRKRLILAAILSLVIVAGVVTYVTLQRPGSNAQQSPNSSAQQSWRLVWSDDFNGTALNADDWTVENRSTFGNGNNELACLMSTNVVVANGLLALQARRASPPVTCGSHDTRFPNGREYTSAMISTKNKASWHQGRFEIRAKLPVAPGTSKGMWPAFWLRPQSGDGDGELDILEAMGTDAADLDDAGKVHQTLFYDENKTYPKKSTVTAVSDPDGAFHVYACDWTDGQMTWSVDGKTAFSVGASTAPWIDRAFSGNFFLRLNLAVGGDFPGAPTDATQLPADFAVDWVKVYQQG
jgi:beta-glucanase (GH16 family)